MIIDTTLIILCGALLSIAIASPFLSPFIRLKKEEHDVEKADSELPPLSVLITPHRQGPELEKNVALILEQDYPAPLEIIIVVEKGDAESEDALKRLSSDKRVIGSFVPESSRYMSKKKLAITLGVKASHYEWIMMTDASCAPMGDQWLKTMARHCNDHSDFIIGYSNYCTNTSPFYRFEMLHTACYLYREASRGTAYRTNGTNLIFRKSLFVDGDGYRGNLDICRGEYDFLVNKYAQKGRTVVELSPAAWMIDEKPTKRILRGKDICYIHTRKFLKRKISHRLLPLLDMTAKLLTWTLILTTLFYAIIDMLSQGPMPANIILVATIAISFAINCILSSITAKPVLKYFDTRHSIWRVPFYEIRLFWHRIYTLLRYWKSDKTDYTTHKL